VQRSALSHPGVPLLTISMVDGVVVVAPPAELDVETTEALVNTVAAATACGETVMVELELDGERTPTDWPRPHAEQLRSNHQAGPPPRVVAPGCVQLAARHEVWTVDLGRRRFCRSADAIDPQFVLADRWTAIRALWATDGRVTILTDAGAYVSASAAWEVQEGGDDPGRGERTTTGWLATSAA